MLITDYQFISGDVLKELDNTVLVYDENTEGTATKMIQHIVIPQVERFYGFVTYKHQIQHRTWRTAVPIPLGAYIEDVYDMEIALLKQHIEKNLDKTFLINPLGIFVDSGMVFFECIRPRMPEDLQQYDNVVLLWNNIPNYKEIAKNKLIPTSMLIDGRWSNPKIPYKFLQRTGNKVDINRINNKHIPIDLKNGIYVKE